MTETQAPTSKHALTFVSGKLGGGAAGLVAGIAVVAALVIVARRSAMFEPSGDLIGWVAVLALLVCMLVLTIRGRWIIEVDPVARRLTIFRVFTLRRTMMVLRTTVVEDCSFDECREIGAINRGDEAKTYGVYLDFKRGGTHVIPVENGLLSEATKNATKLAAMTGIPRRDDPHPGYYFIGSSPPGHGGPA
jgi:hypothetical protein